MIPNIPGYRISKKIGEGGTSIVYSAVHEPSSRRVALKIMNPELLEDPANLKRFSRQVNIAKKLNHNHIVKTYCMEQHGPYHYIVMELLGESLKDRLGRRGYLNVDEALAIVRSVAEALTYAHSQGIVHWDIKPGNILFRSSDHPVIVDFGLAFCRDLKVSLTSQKSTAGTPLYMSPEHCKGEKGEAAGDIYSLGVVLYESLTGKVPYGQIDVHELVCIFLDKKLPPPLPLHLKRYQPLINKMLAFDKRKRFKDGKKIIRVIDKLNNGHKGAGLSFWEKWKGLKIQGIPALVALFATALIIVLGLLIFNVINIPGNDNPLSIKKVERGPGKDKLFDPRMKTIANLNEPSIRKMDVTVEEKSRPLPEQPPTDVQITQGQQTTTQTLPDIKITANKDKQETPGTTPTVQPTTPKPIEISTIPPVSLNQLDSDIRFNIEAKFKKITINAGGISGITKKGNAQAVITLDSSGSVKSIAIQGIEVEPKEKMAEVKSNLVQRISSMNFPPPTINGKPVNVKIGINFSKVAKFSGSIIFEI